MFQLFGVFFWCKHLFFGLLLGISVSSLLVASSDSEEREAAVRQGWGRDTGFPKELDELIDHVLLPNHEPLWAVIQGKIVYEYLKCSSEEATIFAKNKKNFPWRKQPEFAIVSVNGKERKQKRLPLDIQKYYKTWVKAFNKRKSEYADKEKELKKVQQAYEKAKSDYQEKRSQYLNDPTDVEEVHFHPGKDLKGSVEIMEILRNTRAQTLHQATTEQQVELEHPQEQFLETRAEKEKMEYLFYYVKNHYSNYSHDEEFVRFCTHLYDKTVEPGYSKSPDQCKGLNRFEQQHSVGPFAAELEIYRLPHLISRLQQEYYFFLGMRGYYESVYQPQVKGGWSNWLKANVKLEDLKARIKSAGYQGPMCQQRQDKVVGYQTLQGKLLVAMDRGMIGKYRRQFWYKIREKRQSLRADPHLDQDSSDFDEKKKVEAVYGKIPIDCESSVSLGKFSHVFLWKNQKISINFSNVPERSILQELKIKEYQRVDNRRINGVQESEISCDEFRIESETQCIIKSEFPSRCELKSHQICYGHVLQQILKTVPIFAGKDQAIYDMRDEFPKEVNNLPNYLQERIYLLGRLKHHKQKEEEDLSDEEDSSQQINPHISREILIQKLNDLLQKLAKVYLDLNPNKAMEDLTSRFFNHPAWGLWGDREDEIICPLFDLGWNLSQPILENPPQKIALKNLDIEDADLFRPRIGELLKDINEIHLANNQLTGNMKIDGELKSYNFPFTWITILDISHNNLTNLKYFEELKNLQELYAQHNQLHIEPADNDWFPGRILDLSYNKLKQIPAILKCTNLQDLNLSYNEITMGNWLPKGLQKLNIAGNKFADNHLLNEITSSLPNLELTTEESSLE
ncbi:MAG: hypothetical protein ABFQ95_06780 [Pseudomonadota bacterium]